LLTLSSLACTTLQTNSMVSEVLFRISSHVYCGEYAEIFNIYTNTCGAWTTYEYEDGRFRFYANFGTMSIPFLVPEVQFNFGSI
jgi:hypothetical protein